MPILFKILQQQKYQTILLLVFYIFILCSNQPKVFVYGRFWMEEGTVFFNSAWMKSPINALFFSYAGYLNLPVNIATLIARWTVPLEYAPYITTLIGLLLQLTPIFLILTAKDKWLSAFNTRLLATLLLLFVPETSIDISLHTLNSQFHITLACAIILFLQAETNYQRWLRLGIILLATLSGLMPILLIPLYGIKIIIEKNKFRLEQFAILFIGCIIQYVFFYQKYPERLYHFSISDFLSIFFTRDILLTFIGYNKFTESFMLRHGDLLQHGHHFFLIPSVFTCLFMVVIIVCFYKYPHTRSSIFLFIYAIFSLVLAIFGEVGGTIGFYLPRIHSRYTFISISLLSLMLLYFSCVLPKIGQTISKIIIIWLILIGLLNFYSFHPSTYYTYQNHQNTILPWKQQVQIWRKTNGNYLFQLWPIPWIVILPIQYDKK